MDSDYSETTTFVEGYVASALEQFDEVNVGVLGGEADVPDSRQVLADEIRGQIEVLEGELQEIRNRLNATDEFGGDLYLQGDEDNAIAKQAEIDILQSDLDDVFAGRSDDGPSVQDRVAEKLARVRRKKLHGTEETAAIPFDPKEHEATVGAGVELIPLPDALVGTGFDELTDDELVMIYEGLNTNQGLIYTPPELPQHAKDVLELVYAHEGEALRDQEFAPILLNRLQARGLMVPTAEEAAAKRGRDNLYILSVEKLTGVKMTDYARDHIYNLPATGRFAHHLELPSGLTTGQVKERGAISVAAHMSGEDLDQLHDIIMGLRSGGLDKEIFGPRVAELLGTLKDVDRRELATAVIAQVHDEWAVSAGDHHPDSLATQVAAARAAGMNQEEVLARAFYFLEQARDRNATQQIADSIVARIRRGEISPDVLNDENKLKALVLRHGTLSDDIMEMATGGGLLPGSGASESMMGFLVNDDMPTGTIGINASHSLTAMDDAALETISNLDLDAVARTEGKSMLELVYEVDPKTGKRPEVTARMEEIRQELGLDAWDDLPLDDPESRPLALEYLELAKRETPAIGSDEQAVWDLFLALRRDDILPSSPHDSRLGQPSKDGGPWDGPSPRWEEAHLDALHHESGLYFNFEKASDIGLLMDRDRLRAAIARGRTEAQFSQIIPAEFELLGIEEELKRRGVVENDRQHEALRELMASVQAVADLELDRRGQGGVMPSVGFGETPRTVDSGARVEYMQAAVGALIIDDFFGEYNQSVLSADTAAAQEFLKGIANADGTITLYRGVNTDAFDDGVETGETVWDVNASPRSSWAFDPEVAKNFAGAGDRGYVFESRIPIEDVAGLSILGSGCLHEAEVIVVGNDREVKIYHQNEEY